MNRVYAVTFIDHMHGYNEDTVRGVFSTYEAARDRALMVLREFLTDHDSFLLNRAGFDTWHDLVNYVNMHIGAEEEILKFARREWRELLWVNIETVTFYDA